jgi:homoserine O-succinyltransferase
MAEIQTAPLEAAAGTGQTLRIVLVNNMADPALAITEQRFSRLMQAACPLARIDFRCVTLPAIPRGEMAAARIAKLYMTLDGLRATSPDALLFSGAEPVSDSLRDEVFWPGLTELFNWAAAQSIPSLFSCLAAHAAVLHFSGVERRRLPRKKFGFFMQSAVNSHALLAGLPQYYSVAHSRWNDLDAEDLQAGGYDVLTQGPNAGVDLFVPRSGPPQMLIQGHPEYEDTALASEYHRDFKRFENKLSDYKPSLPVNEQWGSSALACAADAPQSTRTPSRHSYRGFETVLGNWMKRKKEMAG